MQYLLYGVAFRLMFQHLIVGSIRDAPSDPTVWTDADWFKLIWNKLITMAVKRTKPLSQRVAEYTVLPMYNHCMVYKVICTLQEVGIRDPVASKSQARGK